MLREAEQLEERLLTLVGHEMRTPLTTIFGTLTTLRHYAERVDHAAPRRPARRRAARVPPLERLVESLLMAARLDADDVTFRRTPLLVRGVVADAVRRRARRSGWRSTSRASLGVTADPVHLGTVVQQLRGERRRPRRRRAGRGRRVATAARDWSPSRSATRGPASPRTSRRRRSGSSGGSGSTPFPAPASGSTWRAGWWRAWAASCCCGRPPARGRPSSSGCRRRRRRRCRGCRPSVAPPTRRRTWRASAGRPRSRSPGTPGPRRGRRRRGVPRPGRAAGRTSPPRAGRSARPPGAARIRRRRRTGALHVPGERGDRGDEVRDGRRPGPPPWASPSATSQPSGGSPAGSSPRPLRPQPGAVSTDHRHPLDLLSHPDANVPGMNRPLAAAPSPRSSR